MTRRVLFCAALFRGRPPFDSRHPYILVDLFSSSVRGKMAMISIFRLIARNVSRLFVGRFYTSDDFFRKQSGSFSGVLLRKRRQLSVLPCGKPNRIRGFLGRRTIKKLINRGDRYSYVSLEKTTNRSIIRVFRLKVTVTVE